MQNKICVYAICKNEIQFVDRWLNSMSEADYIVVLDTGSTDGTFEKLKDDSRIFRVEQKIISPWRFDVARNVSMTLIPDDANILVCTDFDEVLNLGWADILRNKWKEDTTRGYYRYAWSHNEAGEPADIFKYDKIHSRDYEWVFPVHEVLFPKDRNNFHEVKIDFKDQIFLHHYPDQTKSRSAYYDLLKISVQENPNDSHVRMLYARECMSRKEYDEALKEYLATLQMPDVDAPNKRLVLLECLGRCADIYAIQQNYDEAIWYCQEFIKEDPTYREPYFIMAELYNNMHMYTLAEACIGAALKYSTRKYTWVERKDSWLGLSNNLLSISQIGLRQYDQAIQNCSEALKHDPNSPELLKRMNMLLNIKLQEIDKKEVAEAHDK